MTKGIYAAPEALKPPSRDPVPDRSSAQSRCADLVQPENAELPPRQLGQDLIRRRCHEKSTTVDPFSWHPESVAPLGARGCALCDAEVTSAARL